MNQVASDFFVAGGTLHVNAPSYVERHADRELRELAEAGKMCYVLTTRQMGKSSLMVRTKAYLKERGIYTVSIDLTGMGKASIDEFYLSLLESLQSNLPIVTGAEEWWEKNIILTQVRRFTKFVQEVILEEVDGQVIIFIDEIDRMLNLDYADDFFAAIRYLHNQGAVLPTGSQATFVLLGAASPSDLIKDPTHTPFNIGSRIQLDELTLTEAQVLVEGLPERNQAILDRIFYWTNGHPYLTQVIGLSVAKQGEKKWSDGAIDELVERLFLTDEVSAKESNLRTVRDRVTSSKNKNAILSLYQKVYDGKKILSNEQSIFQNELKLFGLLRADEKGHLVIRNRIYRRVFDEEWIRENNPINWWRWTAVAAAIFAIIVIIFLVVYWQQTPQPDDVLFQSYTTDFQETANPTLRLNNLANIFALEGYEAEALRLFDSLTNDEQIAMFEAATPDLSPQVQQIVEGSYSSLVTKNLHQAEDTTRLLQAVYGALEESTDAGSQALKSEIGIWIEARKYAESNEYVGAKTAYDLAINQNSVNPAMRYERALIAMLIDDPDAAIEDLIIVWEFGPPWEQKVIDTINNNNELQNVSLAMMEAPPFSSFVFTPTPTSTPTPTPTPTILPTSTPTPLPTLTPTRTPSPAEEKQHIVQQDEVLSRIGEEYGFSVAELVAYNDFINPTFLDVDQVLKIPPNDLAGEIPTSEVKIIADAAALKSGPGREYGSDDHVQQGESVIVLGCSDDCTWLYVWTYTEEEGWIINSATEGLFPEMLYQVPYRSNP